MKTKNHPGEDYLQNRFTKSKYMSYKTKWKFLHSKILYKYRFFNIIQDDIVQPDGKEAQYTYLDSSGSVIIIPKDAEGNFYLLKEYRYPPKKIFLGLPAGHINRKLSASDNARKELLEELGTKAITLREIGEFNSMPSRLTSPMYVYIAVIDEKETNKDNNEGNEDIVSIIKVSLKQLKKLIAKNKIQDGPALAALNIYLNQEE
jgi:ADP-ribose pyrophosphatase